MADRTALVVSYYFPPMGLSGVQRTFKFVKYLSKFGWKPIVLTASPSGYYAYDDSVLSELEDSEYEIFKTESRKDKAGVTRIKTLKFPSYTYQKFGRALLQTIYQPDSKIKWKKKAIELGSKIIEENNIDIIFATAPPFTGFLVARELSEKYKIPFVVDYRDVWVDNPFHFYATPMHKSYSVKLEKDILTHAEKVIVITREAKEKLLQRYRFISHNDIEIVPHGYDPEDFETAKYVKPDPKKFTVTHSGLFQDDRSPKYFFKAVANLVKRNKDFAEAVELRFVGIMRRSHQKLIKKYKLTDKTNLVGYVRHSEAVKHLIESDLLWLMLFDSVRTPGKLYEYFGAAKPILACLPEGSMRKTALESTSTIATDPKDVKAIENALETFFKLWRGNNMPIPTDSFIEQYDRSFLTSKLARILAEATKI